jgi:hypothetical protein
MLPHKRSVHDKIKLPPDMYVIIIRKSDNIQIKLYNKVFSILYNNIVFTLQIAYNTT